MLLLLKWFEKHLKCFLVMRRGINKQTNIHTSYSFIRSFIHTFTLINVMQLKGIRVHRWKIRHFGTRITESWRQGRKRRHEELSTLPLSAYKAGHKSPLWSCSLLPYQKENNLYHWRDGTEMGLYKQTLLNKIILIYL